MIEMVTLVEHLKAYGILHFPPDRYWDWGGEKLGRKVGTKLNKLLEPLQNETATPKQLARFYDFIAPPQIAAVVHSMKADAIRASGEAVNARLQGRKRILDLGCSLGYLTTWYALTDPDREVVGIDVSKATIR